MRSSSSKILKLGGIIVLGIFGLAGLVYVRRNKNVSENIEANTQKSESVPETTKEENHGEIIKPASTKTKKKTEFNNPEDLIENVLRDILKDDKFESADEFLGQFISAASVLCEDYSWFNYFPKNSNEVREALEKYGLLEQFDIQLYNKYMKK